MIIEEKIKKVLEQDFKLTVEKISECEKERPDYFAYNNKENYIFEVKEKESSNQIKQVIESTLSSGDIYHIIKPIEAQSTLQNIIRKGKKQIDEFLEDKTTFRVIWVHCTCVEYNGVREQIESGLYGTETLVNSKNGQNYSRICYYFNESLFFKYKDKIDAVIISCKNGESHLCLNNHSPRYEVFKNTRVAENFKEAIVDPLLEEVSGHAFLMDSPIKRKDQDAVLGYLKEKYTLDSMKIMKMSHIETCVYYKM